MTLFPLLSPFSREVWVWQGRNRRRRAAAFEGAQSLTHEVHGIGSSYGLDATDFSRPSAVTMARAATE
jgi:hypothetical protein